MTKNDLPFAPALAHARPLPLGLALALSLAACGGGGPSAGTTSAATTAAATTSAAKTTASASATVAPKPAPEVPPSDKPSLETIPEAAPKGALKGEPFEGVLQVVYSKSSGKLEVSFRDKLKADQPCITQGFDHLVRLNLDKGAFEPNKPLVSPYGTETKGVMTGFGTGGDKGYWSMPVGGNAGVALQIDTFDLPKDSDKPGKIKIRIAVTTRMGADEKPSWFTGTYEGALCAY